jgi:hypothetical protein
VSELFGGIQVQNLGLKLLNKVLHPKVETEKHVSCDRACFVENMEIVIRNLNETLPALRPCDSTSY